MLEELVLLGKSTYLRCHFVMVCILSASLLSNRLLVLIRLSHYISNIQPAMR